ncbi:MAG: hypothetical protein KF901_20065 [Myxococcales bacterium]|nr:hypothetical protein [Myxococcales bacterium]
MALTLCATLACDGSTAPRPARGDVQPAASSGERSSGERSSGERSSGERSSGERSSGARSSGAPPPATPEPAPPSPERADEPRQSPRPRCAAPIPLYEDGERRGEVCEADLEARGLTALDLADDWTPYIFRDDPTLGELGRDPYRPIYLALADERLDEVPRGHDAERFLELFGIQPTLRVILERLDEDERHACHDAIDDAPIEALTFDLHAWSTEPAVVRERMRQARYLRHRLGREAESRGLASLDELATDRTWGAHYARMRRLEIPYHAVATLQAHLRCDGLFGNQRVEEGIFEWRTATALRAWQQKHAILGAGSLDAETRTWLTKPSRERTFRQLLRTLRERVVDAAALLEDGSAAHAWQPVLGRELDGPQVRFEAGHPAAPNPAPDLVSPATEAAARALGFVDPERARAALRALREREHDRVAVRLPPPPRYQSRHMELRAEIDRGGVWYDYPYTPSGARRAQPVQRRPILTVYARDTDGREVALARWPTTIGAWKPERRPDGTVGLRYKESYVGPRVWRDVIAAPAWLPPPSAPDDELVRRVGGGAYAPNHSLFGPGYRSAYGLVMLVHHQVLPPARGSDEPRFHDQGIRTHGSVSYRSIIRGTSHGCHRLYNHLAVRLAGFVLRHRDHVRHGTIPVRYERSVRAGERTMTFRIDSRGYRYELTPPVPIEVLEGTLRGRVQRAPTGFRPLRPDVAQRAEAEAAEDG